jgi:hypothetical protein
MSRKQSSVAENLETAKNLLKIIQIVDKKCLDTFG